MTEADTAGAEGRTGWLPGMLAWGVALGLFLMLCLGIANWKGFHLAYCRHLLRSGQPQEQLKGVYAIRRVHLRPGMDRQAVEALFAPLQFEANGPDQALLRVWLVKTPERESYSGLGVRYRDGKLAYVGFAGGGGSIPSVRPEP